MRYCPHIFSKPLPTAVSVNHDIAMRYTEEEQNLIILSSLGVPAGAKRAVLSALKSFTDDFAQCESILIKKGYGGVYNKVRNCFYSGRYREEIFAGLERRGVECVTLASEDYPEYLKNTDDPPVALYLLGRRELLKRDMFSVVGSRRTTPYALELCKKFSAELSEHFVIVSGSAEGADSAALESAKTPLSVLAFGFDSIGSVANTRFLEKIEKTGLLVSEYFPTERVKRFNFPVRNRIIAGLSKGTLVVSAAQKSGALITARYAAEYMRDLFAFPYNLGVTSGEGCNSLIKKGASLVQNPLDILSAFGLDLNPRPETKLTEEEREVYSKIKEAGEIFVTSLAEKLGAEPYKLITVLSSLEIKGLVCRLGGNRYSAL